ncbi:MAG TPA: tryptophan-rich sensory protein [Anaerolineales bacterium]|nr:tryptophan-rich sensory protein [Anaerolineales bacterium]
MNKDTLRQLANALSVVLALTVNILAAALPLNNQTTAQISDRFKVFFVPAGYVFSVWGIIYIGWIAFALYQFLPAHKESPRLRGLGYLFALSGVFNAAWLFCWQYNHFTLSVLVMLVLLALLIASYLQLNIGRTSVTNAEKWCVDIPLSVYLGWISVATIANISDWLYFVHWNGFGIAPQGWAVIMLVAASLVGLWMALTRRDSGYLFVLVWAFIGIAVKQSASALVAASALLCALIVLGLAILSLVQRRRLPA